MTVMLVPAVVIGSVVSDFDFFLDSLFVVFLTLIFLNGDIKPSLQLHVFDLKGLILVLITNLNFHKVPAFLPGSRRRAMGTNKGRCL